MCAEAGVQPVLLAGNHDPDEEFSLLKLQGGRFTRSTVMPCSRKWLRGGGNT